MSKIPLSRQRPSCLPYLDHDPPLDPVNAMFYIHMKPHEICEMLRRNKIIIQETKLVRKMYQQSHYPGFAEYIKVHGREMSKLHLRLHLSDAKTHDKTLGEK